MPVTRATVAVRGRVYERLDDERREDETFNDVIDRLLDDYRGDGV
jgi:predicted CopG family antitoxin